MIFKNYILILMSSIVFYSCNLDKEKGNNNTFTNVNVKEKKIIQDLSKLSYLIHTTNMKVEHFIDNGLITKNDFIREFQKIDWDKEAENVAKTFTTNITRLEVVDSLKYLTISVDIGRAKEEIIKEFSIGIGDIDIENGEKQFFVELYGTKKLDEQEVIQIINLFFDKRSNDLLAKLEEFEYYVSVKDPHYIVKKN